MPAISIQPVQVRPLNGAIIRRYSAGAALSVGQAVFVESDGTAKPADADNANQVQARGVVVAVGAAGALEATLGSAVDVVTHGPVALGTSGLTDGAVVYVSPTAGALDHTAPSASGTYPFVIGWAESDGVLYVQPQVIPPTVNS